MVGMIIADDELLIRQGLITIPWNDYGIEVLGVASNGEEVLSMILSNQLRPQILLTDIRMPRIDGLDLIDSVKKEIPEIKSILLTGYQDFQYARTAIKLGACGYILKPSDPNEIIETVLKAKQQVELELRDKEETSLIKQKFDNAKIAIRDSFLYDLIYGRIEDTDKIKRQCYEYNLSLDQYVLMLVEFDTKNNDFNQGMIKEVERQVREITLGKTNCYMLAVSYSVFCVIIDVCGEHQIKDSVLSLAQRIRKGIKDKLEIGVSIGISACDEDVKNMNILYNQSMNCLKMMNSQGLEDIVHVDDLHDLVNPVASRNKVIQEIIKYIDTHYMEEISLLSVSEFVHMNHIYVSRLVKKELGETFLEILTRTRMKRACELLINGMYKTYEVSEKVGIKDAGYFSQVFKKHTGMTPLEYREDYYTRNKSKVVNNHGKKSIL